MTNVVKNVMQTRVQQLWSLFPSFCSKAMDVAQVMPTLGPMLGNAMQDGRYPRMQRSVCVGLDVLCKENSDLDLGDSTDDVTEQRKINAATLSRFSPNFPHPVRRVRAVQRPRVFKRHQIVRNICIERAGGKYGESGRQKAYQSTVSLDETSATASIMLGLATALMPKLSVKQRDVLYKAISPCLGDNSHGNVQKRGIQSTRRAVRTPLERGRQGQL